jgi:hypothetical protein
MRRGLLTFAVLGSLAYALAAQPPAPPVLPPAPPVPPGGVAPLAPPLPLAAPKLDVPLAQFEPLTAFPVATQFAVAGAVRGSGWVAKAQQPNGRFVHGYNPALRQPLAGDHDLKQARAALALAQAAKFAGDDKLAATANQAVLTLLAATKVPADAPNCRIPVNASLVCNRVGFAATLALAIYELPAPGAKLLEDAERLCEFLRRALRTDGSVHYTDGATDVPAQVDPAGANEYPGLALQALALSNRLAPAEWKKDAVKRGVTHYHLRFRAHPHPLLAATVLPAAADLYAQTKLNEMASAGFEMGDWLIAQQIGPTDAKLPHGAGGFRAHENGKPTDAQPTASDTGLCVQGLACAFRLSQLAADATREGKYKPALVGAVEFLCGLQFVETNTRHFENTFRANVLIGGFHHTPTDGTLYTDGTATAITGLLQFLGSGAEKR